MENENYLADWLAGKMSDEQLRNLVSEEDFLAFQKVKNTLGQMAIATPELEESYAAIKRKKATPKAVKVRKIVPVWAYAVAACLLLSVGWYQLYFFSNEMQTPFGSTKTLVLDDDSKVTLNAKSTLRYANLFQYNRTLELDGEAFFEVEKGSSFVVKTKIGQVKVLGTKFNVASFSDYFEVVCYEGKVKVDAQHQTNILTQGERVRFYNGIVENWAGKNTLQPLWIQGETELKNVPMKYVFAQFENQFAVDVVYPEKIKNIKFTGSFSNRNKETALQSICIPLQLNYSKNASGTIRISE